MTKPTSPDDEFHDALMSDDELSVVLRAYFYIEMELDALIGALLPFPEELPRLRFDQKIRLVCALGLDKSAAPPLREFGELRNQFGHQVGAKLTMGAVNKLFSAFNTADQSIIQAGYNKTRTDLEGDLPEYEKLGAKDRFVILSVTLRRMLKASKDEITPKRT